jgi:hypothetical protein
MVELVGNYNMVLRERRVDGETAGRADEEKW